ncbi:uncharacterized protein LOC144942453 [Lampetra fluviatilis]
MYSAHELTRLVGLDTDFELQRFSDEVDLYGSVSDTPVTSLSGVGVEGPLYPGVSAFLGEPAWGLAPHPHSSSYSCGSGAPSWTALASPHPLTQLHGALQIELQPRSSASFTREAASVTGVRCAS